MADAATLSRFYFCRVFQRVTGVSPVRFLSAIRLNEAKRMLLTTSLSVTDICMAVGYTSLGTFTRRFTLSVGTPPTRFRHLLKQPPLPRPPAWPPPSPSLAAVKGSAEVKDASVDGPILLGLFRGPIPEGPPASCAVLGAPGQWCLYGVPRGRWFVLAQAMPGDGDPLAVLLPWDHLLPIGGAGPIAVKRSDPADVDVVLHPPRLIDPPVLLAPPAFLSRQAAGRRAR